MANPNPYRPISIERAGGFESYMNLPEIVAKHNNLGYDDLLLRLKLNVSNRQIAKDFGLSEKGGGATVAGWKKRIENNSK